MTARRARRRPEPRQIAGAVAAALVAVAAVVAGAILAGGTAHPTRLRAVAPRAAPPQTTPSSPSTSSTTVCVPPPPQVRSFLGPLPCMPDFIRNAPPPTPANPAASPPQVVYLPAIPTHTPRSVAPCPPGSGTPRVTVTFLSSPYRFDRHCYYVSSGHAQVTFVDNATRPDTGLIIPTTLTVSPSDNPSVAAEPGKLKGSLSDPSKNVAASPDAVDVGIPVTFTLPDLPPGGYDLVAPQASFDPVAVLVVTKGG